MHEQEEDTVRKSQPLATIILLGTNVGSQTGSQHCWCSDECLYYFALTSPILYAAKWFPAGGLGRTSPIHLWILCRIKRGPKPDNGQLHQYSGVINVHDARPRTKNHTRLGGAGNRIGLVFGVVSKHVSVFSCKHPFGPPHLLLFNLTDITRSSFGDSGVKVR